MFVRLTTWLRSQMGKESLALLHIHSDIQLGVDAIIDRLSKEKKNFNFIL